VGDPKFDRFAETYSQDLDASVRLSGEDGEYFAAYKAGYIRARFQPSKNCKILDYGCGKGLLSAALKAALPAARIDGFDVSLESLTRIDIGLRQQGTFTDKLEALENDYTLVVIANVLHHIAPTERQHTLSKIAGKLVTGGVAAVFEHNPLNPLTRWAVNHCAFDENAILLWPREVVGYLRGAGLANVELNYIVFFPRALQWLRKFELHLGWCRAGAQYVMIARKSV
jgi:2-polyprenyl-3-methyl-5-hydroxy-6-metoxy-1,4-benzoquinol methylase